MTSDLRAEVEIWPFSACAMHPAIITGTAWSLWTWQCYGSEIPRSTERISSLKGIVFVYLDARPGLRVSLERT